MLIRSVSPDTPNVGVKGPTSMRSAGNYPDAVDEFTRGGDAHLDDVEAATLQMGKAILQARPGLPGLVTNRLGLPTLAALDRFDHGCRISLASVCLFEQASTVIAFPT